VRLDIGFEGGVLLNSLSLSLRATNLPVSFAETESSLLFSYIAGVKVQAHITEWVEVTGRVRASYLKNVRDTDLRFLDTSLEARLNIYRGLGLSVGLRRVEWDQIDSRGDQRFSTESILNGPFVGISYSF
jgi:hypothetical protein